MMNDLNWLALTFSAVLTAMAWHANAQSIDLKFEPLDIDYAKHCRVQPSIKTNRDWRLWQGEKVSVPAQELVKLADAYSSNSSGLPKDLDTSGRILEYLKTARNYHDGQTAIIGARIALAQKTDGAAMALAVKDLESEFQRGNIGATFLLGQAYEQGLGVSADKLRALSYFKLSATADKVNGMIRTAVLMRALGADRAQQRIATVSAITNLVSAVEGGDCSAANMLHKIYMSGELGIQDTALATRWYEVVAKAGSARAAMRLGQLYAQGRFVEADRSKSVHYFEMAARTGDPKGAFEAGRAYAHGLGVEPDADRAVQYLEQAGEGHVDKAWTELAHMHSPAVNPAADPRTWFRYLERGAKGKKPDTSILEDYASALLKGVGTPSNSVAAVDPLKLATDAGSAKAAWLLGQLYFYGDDTIGRDSQRGLKLIRFAATSGEHSAASLLAVLYRCGATLAQSSEKADLWQQRAAFFGSSSAMNKLANKAKDYDPLLAELYLRKAVRSGSGQAVIDLANFYRDGQWSAPDRELAQRWEDFANADVELLDAVRFARASRLRKAGSLEPALAILSAAAFIDEGRVAFERGRILEALGSDNAKSVEASLRTAADRGNTSAMWELGLRAGKTNGQVLGHDRDYWLHSAAKLGHTRAMISLAEGRGDLSALQTIFESGKACSSKDLLALAKAMVTIGGDSVRDKALSYVSVAESLSEGEDSSTLTSVGEALISIGLDEKIKRRGQTILQEAADKGDAGAARILGIALAQGTTEVVSLDKAINYLILSIKPGDDLPAKVMLNSLRGASPENTPKAFAKLEAVAADLSSTVLKKVQELSFGQDAVAEHGSALIEHAAEQGNAAALVILADRKFSGFKSDRDIAEGIRLLKKAAQTGYPEALKALAAAYEVGFGVTQNDVEAQRLRNGIAMQQGELLQ